MSASNCVKIFARDDGQPLKFRIQPDLEPSVRKELEKDIAKYGGVVTDKLPVRGFVVVDPNSMLGKALIGTWTLVGGTERHFVSTSYVKKCVEAKALLPVEDAPTSRTALAPVIEAEVCFSRDSNNLSCPPISKEQKTKLARYLSQIPVENRASIRTFKDLIGQNELFPWATSLPWQSFRNDYFRNKRSYERKIRKIIECQKKALSQDNFIDLQSSSGNSSTLSKSKSASVENIKHIEFEGCSRMKRISATSREEENTELTQVNFGVPTDAFIVEDFSQDPLESDDMRSYRILNTTSGRIRYQTPIIEEAELSESSTSRRSHYTNQSYVVRGDVDAFSTALAKAAKLSVDEAKQILSDLSGDNAQTKVFPEQINRRTNDFSFQYFDGPSSISQAA